MKSHHLPVALILLAAACARKDAAPATDTTAAAPAVPSQVAVTDGFSTPEAVLWDAEQQVWFVANINGNPAAKDNNGFISRLNADGAIDSLGFIRGGRDGVTLNGPKGMVIVGDTLWVADIDAVRGFNRRTGAPVGSVEFGKQARFLNDIAIGPNNVLYVTDTGLEATAQGINHAGPDKIFTITNRLVALAIEGAFLNGPNGIIWDAPNNRFIVVSFAGTTLLGWKPGETTVDTVAIGAGQLDGVEIVNGDLLVSSWTDSTLSLVKDGTVTKLVHGVASPADLGVDQTRGIVAVPIFLGTTVEFWRMK